MQYPNKCAGAAAVGVAVAAAVEAAVEVAETPERLEGVDMPLDDAFTSVESHLDPTAGGCCTFRVGDGCDAIVPARGLKSFEGFVDEVAVWSRALTPADVAAAMFPAGRGGGARRVSPPAGVQVDVSAGRALYARFNRPCVGGGLSPAAGLELDAGEVDDASGNSGLRYPAAAGGRVVTDTLDDSVTLVGFPRFTKYVLTGAPWAPPLVTGIAGGGDGGPTVPLDGGGKVSLFGVGFARSPFLTCALAPPPPLGRAGTEAAAAAAAAEGVAEYSSPTAVRAVGTRTPFVRLGSSASTLFTPAPAHQVTALPPLSAADLRHPGAVAASAQAWGRASPASRLGEIPPLQPLPVRGGGGGSDITYAGVVYGWHEVVECATPAAPFPSDRHELSVSNDGGSSGSPFGVHARPVYMDFAGAFDGSTSRLDLPATLRTVMGTAFTITMWVMIDTASDVQQQLIKISAGNTGVMLAGGKLFAQANGNPEAPGFPGVSLGEWHFVSLAMDRRYITFVVDGGSAGSGSFESRPFTGLTSPPSEVTVGRRFKGKIDELKVFGGRMSTADIAAGPMWSRGGGPSAPLLLGYYRFNTLGGYPGSGADSAGSERTALTVAVAVVAAAVPWEPASVHAIDGVDSAAGGAPLSARPWLSSRATPGRVLNIDGFNIAKSPFLSCGWSAAEERMPPHYAPVMPPPAPRRQQCAPLKAFGVRDVFQGQLTAPAGAAGVFSASSAAAPLAAYGAVLVPRRAPLGALATLQVPGGTGVSTGVTVAAPVPGAGGAGTGIEGTTATCPVPPGEPATVRDFALGNSVGLTAWRWASTTPNNPKLQTLFCNPEVTLNLATLLHELSTLNSKS